MESDINDPFVHIDLENLPNYSRHHIMQWLVYRGDSLQAIHSLKDGIIDRIKQNKRHSFKNPPEKAVKKNTTKNTDAMENKAMTNLVRAAQKSALDLQSVME